MLQHFIMLGERGLRLQTSFYYLNAQLRIGVTDIFQESIILFAHERFLVMTGNIMPVNTIVVELIQKSQAVFGSTILFVFTVIGLRKADTTVGGPITLAAFVGGSQFLQSSSPEPTVNVGGLQVGTFTALEVTETARGPDVFYLLMRKRRKFLKFYKQALFLIIHSELKSQEYHTQYAKNLSYKVTGYF